MNLNSKRKNFLGLLFGALLVFGPSLSSPVLAQEQGLENLRETGQAFRSVAKKVSPAVVFISVEKEISGQRTPEMAPFGPFGDEFFRRFFGQPPGHSQPKAPSQKRKSAGQGSGFVISSDGYILTNNHVVEDADTVTVQMENGQEYTAEIIGTDPPSDLAVIKVEKTGLPYLKLGDSSTLEVGDWVLAVGNPFGLSHTLTAGIVSAKGRSGIGLNDYENFIQTDAAINPGNSGGPLVNLNGEVVGINTAIFSRSGGYMGIGFAIPVNMAKLIKNQLIEDGRVTRGRLGVYIQDVNNELAESFDLDAAKGILVSQVMEDSPAEDAGLKQGDIILELNGKDVGKVTEFRNKIALTIPGTKVELTIQRDGKEQTVDVKIGKMETDDQGRPAAPGKLPKLGLSLQELTPELAEKLGYEDEQGVLVSNVEAGSNAAEAGIKRGDLIVEANRKAIRSPEQLKEMIKEGKGKHLLLLVRKGDNARYLTLKLDR